LRGKRGGESFLSNGNASGRCWPKRWSGSGKSSPPSSTALEMLPSSGDRSSVLQSAALQMRLKPGTKLGEYGGMGEVYRAHDGRLGREVAIKVLPAALSGNVERLHRLNQEARTAAALNQTQSLPTLSSLQETRLENANRLPAASSPAPRALPACPAFGETRSTGGPHVIERVPGRSDNSQLAGRG